MPPTPEAEMRIAGKGGTSQPPPPPMQSALQKKLVLLLGMIVLGLPVFVVLLGPPLLGVWILGHQFGLYQSDARWRPFSVFEWVTDTVDRDLAENLGWPDLASCREFGEVPASEPGGGGLTTEQIQRGCPQLGPWQAWLLRPNALFGWHGYLAPVLRFIPISSLLFLFGLIMAGVLRLVGLRWRSRNGPPPPKPLISSSVSRKQTSGPTGFP